MGISVNLVGTVVTEGEPVVSNGDGKGVGAGLIVSDGNGVGGPPFPDGLLVVGNSVVGKGEVVGNPVRVGNGDIVEKEPLGVGSNVTTLGVGKKSEVTDGVGTGEWEEASLPPARHAQDVKTHESSKNSFICQPIKR